ncbi:MAG TPA: thioredoxin domain-containing protein [Gemmatimonadaceae bacterium]|nr:thioredoxin domain-containing protein [Gemmatimonadaceae bacterium]
MPNRLANETSPYLLQHADNPVDWHPWGPEALEKARAENKPVLLSIGYAACHWCHVMAHESFEHEATARVMNENFVNIKVDREERPDNDGIYMQAVQALTGHGGWPMTVFLTPDGTPFYGGTYYPPEDRQGMPSFTKILHSVADAYRNRRETIDRTSAQLREIYDSAKMQARSEGPLSAHAFDLAYRGIVQRYDVRHGGFEGAPKFPQTMTLDFLLRYWKRTGTDYSLQMVMDSFRKMARGGLYDQIGGGFHRYTVDAIWLVPHFEKMLYDNALLVRLGVHLWQATHDNEVRTVVEETVKWLEREMTSPQGGFYSSLDADSEGEEGRFYIWSESEIDSLLRNDSPIVKGYYGVTPGGNFEGRNILHVRGDPSMAAARFGITPALLTKVIADAKTTLYETRSKRVWPGRDEKVLASWNGLMLRGLATAARVFERGDFASLAIRNGEFLQLNMVRDRRVMRSWKNGRARIPGFLEDYAAVALGFLALYELTFDNDWVVRAAEIGDAMVEWFWDEQLGAFFDTPHDAEALIARPRDVTDNATPSGTSLAVDLLLSLSELLQDPDSRRRANFVLETLATPFMRYPSAFGHILGAADMAVNGAVEVAIAGNPKDRAFKLLEHEVATHYVPSLVLAGGTNDGEVQIALLEGREARSGKATAYVCRSYACEEPATEPAVLAAQLEAAPRIQAHSL